MNAVLDELVDHAIKRCYRGPGVDILFFLKHKRDLQTNRFLKKGLDGIQIEIQVMQKDPFFLLNYDEEFKSKTSDVQSFFNKN